MTKHEEWVDAKENPPPIGKVVLCFYVRREKSFAKTLIEVVELRWGALEENKIWYKHHWSMGEGIRAAGGFNADSVKYWADIQPPNFNENWRVKNVKTT